VQMQVDAVVSNVETINNVVADVRAPELNTREVHDIVRIPNHQSLILGGLISTEEERRTFKVPILGDLPLVGKLFQRSKTKENRTEIIIVITPHIAEEIGPRDYGGEENPYVLKDSAFTPIGTDIFDQLDNVLLPSTYLIKQTDIEGMDLKTLEPLKPLSEIGKYSINDPVLLTLFNIVHKLDLVKELRMLDGPVPEWMTGEQVQYNAEAFLILYIEDINELTISELIPGRQIVLPSNPKPEEGFESKTPLWNSINFLQLSQRYDPMQKVVESLMILDGKTPPSNGKTETVGTNNLFTAEGSASADEAGYIDYGPLKVSVKAEDGTYKLVEVTFRIIPKEDADYAQLASRRNDIEALALAIISGFTFEELTSTEGSVNAAAALASGINELFGGEVVGELNLNQTARV